MKINIIFHSIYGHIYRLAEAVVKGAGQVSGTEVKTASETQHRRTVLRLWGGD